MLLFKNLHIQITQLKNNTEEQKPFIISNLKTFKYKTIVPLKKQARGNITLPHACFISN